ncbi:MAG TPA: hypothetical protein VMC48_00525 [Methanobacterium sp.]|nr:hypothetical protein [Methanobacterium sp.]
MPALEVFKIVEDNKNKTKDREKGNITSTEEENKSEANSEKIETCYFCLQKFDINKDDLSHYKYGKFPMCDYCSQFYGFYD